MQKNEPILRDILDKGVQTITPREREAIANKHVAINVQQGVDYSLAWEIVVVGSIVLLLVLSWNRKLNALNKEPARLSVTDKLTGLYNRHKTDEVLDRELRRSLRFDQPFSVILIDIDEFKEDNDNHSHHVSDRVLITIAKLFKEHTRETDVIGRWGGEEFIVICAHTNQNGAVKLAENLRQALQHEDIPTVRQNSTFRRRHLSAK